MKRVKRIACALLALCMLCGLWTAQAADTTPTLQVVSAAGQRGQNVQVTVEIQNNPGLIAAMLQISYDKNVMSLMNVEDGGLLGSDFMPGGRMADVPFKVLWADSLAKRDHTANGTLVTFTFSIKSSAEYGETPVTLEYVRNSCFNLNLEPVTFTVKSGTVNVMPPHEHQYNAVVTNPTCTADGYTTHTCATCGDTYTDTPVEKTGHNYNSVVTNPTCTADGFTTHTCATCGDTYTDTPVEKTGHNYNSVVTNPTCTADGYTTYTCTVCQDTYTADTVTKIPHNYSSVVTNPTCTADGYTTYTCSVCHDTYTGNTVTKTGHNYNSVVTNPTCTAGGYTTNTCATCGDTTVTNRTSPKGHQYGAWVTVTEATATKDGLRKRTCSACDAVETEVIKASTTLAIVNYTPARTVDYRSSITFRAEVKSPLEGYTVHWFVDGKDVGTGDSYTVKEAKKDYTVAAKYMKGNTAELETPVEKVTVKHGFFDKLKAFFKYLFKKPVPVVQALLGIEIL